VYFRAERCLPGLYQPDVRGRWTARKQVRSAFPGGNVSLMLTTLELIERLGALIPPPRRHRHRYYGVLAPNAPLRAAVTALASPRAATPGANTAVAAAAAAALPAPSASAKAAEESLYRRAARYAWAVLLARIYEVLAPA